MGCPYSRNECHPLMIEILIKDLLRSFETKMFSGSIVYPPLSISEFFVRYGSKVCSFWKVEFDPEIPVFIPSSLTLLYVVSVSQGALVLSVALGVNCQLTYREYDEGTKICQSHAIFFLRCEWILNGNKGLNLCIAENVKTFHCTS